MAVYFCWATFGFYLIAKLHKRHKFPSARKSRLVQQHTSTPPPLNTTDGRSQHKHFTRATKFGLCASSCNMMNFSDPIGQVDSIEYAGNMIERHDRFDNSAPNLLEVTHKHNLNKISDGDVFNLNRNQNFR